MHLIYRSKNYESSSKDYDFSRAAMIDHWKAGVRDVHHSMRHKMAGAAAIRRNHGDLRPDGGRLEVHRRQAGVKRHG